MEVSAHKSHSPKKPDLSKAPRQKPEKKEVKGLCVNCSNLDSCTLPGHAMESLLHCEEYFCESGECAPSALPQKPMAAEAVMPEPKGLKGLCVNCDLRFDCSYQKSPGGVWHCAEYQ